MNTIKRFLEPVMKCKKIFLLSLIPYSMWAIGPLGSIILIKYITQAIESGSKDLFFRYIVYFVLFIIFYQSVSWISRYQGWIKIRTDVFKSIYPEFLRKLTYADNTSFEKLGTGKTISLLEQGLSTHILLLERGFHQGTKLLIVLVSTAYFFIIAGWQYGIGFLVVIILMNISLYYGTSRIRTEKYIESGIKNERTRILVRIIMSKMEIMQVNKLGLEITKLDSNIDEKKESILRRAVATHRIFFIPYLIGSLLTLVIFGIVGYGVLEGKNSFSDLVLYAGLLALFESSVLELTFFVKDMLEQSSKIIKMRDVIDGLPQLQGFNEGKEFSYHGGNILLTSVAFSYDGNDKVLDGLSLEIIGGKKTALVGMSGSGKSTLVKLIAGYLRSDCGSIRIDGQDLADVSLKSYYKHVGYLTQEPSVFDGTIIDNLTYAVEGEISQEQLKKSIELSKCEFIRDFKKGVETEIGERGIRLSGGQRQRLAIAKIFLKNPDIIILDEPTSALDSFSEESITQAMHNLFEGRTVIIIAHRLQTVKNADDIIVIDDGNVLERGTHIQLVNMGGSYAKMLELQSGF